jgi:hypothetical protein
MFNIPSFSGFQFAGGFVGLLDLYPNSAAAYSLRKLRAAYTGSAIRVRRTDLAESDIGFNSAGNLDTTSLLAFTGTGALDNGFVTTWYDQSGNGRNATQTNALNQPQIVSSGSVILENGKPSVQFDGSNDYVSYNSALLNNATDVYSSVVFSTTSTTTNQIVHSSPADSGGNRGYDLRLPNSTQIQLAIRTNPSDTNSNAVGNFNYSTGNANLITGTFNASLSSNEQKIYGNGTLVNEVSNSGTSIKNNGTNGGVVIGYFGISAPFGAYLNGNVSELIMYTSDESSNRTGIETNINDFYSIY